MNYGFLTGKKFTVNGELFTVCKVGKHSNRGSVVRAVGSENGKLVDRMFPADKVFDALIVDEEIELSLPR